MSEKLLGIATKSLVFLECGCDSLGSKGKACDQETGICTCKSDYMGDKCNECALEPKR